MNDSAIIDSAVFQAVFLPNSSGESWFTFLVKQDGLWVESIDDHILSLLTDAERLEVTRHPTGNLSEPALKLPCTLGELKAFLAWEGYGDLDGADLADLEAHTKDRHMVGNKAKAGRKPGTHKEHLTAILDALDSWAGENGIDFDRKAMPGPLGESADDEGSFHWLCAKLYPHDFRKTARSFKEHRAGVCALVAYAKQTDFYRQALPHIAQKLGVVLNVSRLPKKARKAA